MYCRYWLLYSVPLRLYKSMWTTNDERRTTNDERRTTNDERRTTNDEQRTTNDERRTTNDERRTTNDERRTTNDERPTTINSMPKQRRQRRRQWMTTVMTIAIMAYSLSTAMTPAPPMASVIDGAETTTTAATVPRTEPKLARTYMSVDSVGRRWRWRQPDGPHW